MAVKAFVALLLGGTLLCIKFVYVDLAVDCSIVADKALCQATFFNQFTNALTQNRKAIIGVNPFFINNTQPCLVQCQLKTGKNTQTLNPIQAPDFTTCQGGGGGTQANKFNKQKNYCYQGQCLTIAQIAPLIANGTGPVVTTVAPGAFWQLIEMGKDWAHIKDEDGKNRIIMLGDKNKEEEKGPWEKLKMNGIIV